MANVYSVRLEVDGPAVSIISVSGILDTSNLTLAVVADPATLNPTDPAFKRKATGLSVSRIEYAVMDGLALDLFWEASPNEIIEELTGRGKFDFHRLGWKSVHNASPTGKILLTTEGWTAGAVLKFSFVIYLRKQTQPVA